MGMSESLCQKYQNIIGVYIGSCLADSSTTCKGFSKSGEVIIQVFSGMESVALVVIHEQYSMAEVLPEPDTMFDDVICVAHSVKNSLEDLTDRTYEIVLEGTRLLVQPE